ncbi:hypothetical protein L211DRAFT_868005 [Terfezia boudieri ATCC MYA-4762]|uniref:Uncharacterized protein n=1 Tax=Terfezia boudieri ATCC MYA-4762 TaxID=1051890 RepID=A0A3N4LRS2_9PEZI|nr:hypothetical protein L211DRAFT_868005 [Terfezia boudieri ATCC MYA-4762]
MDQITEGLQPDGPSRARLDYGGACSNRMSIGNTAVESQHVAALSVTENPLSTTQEPVTAQTNTEGPKDEGDGNPPRFTIREGEVDIWLKLSPRIKSEFKKRWPQVYMEIEQHVQEQATQDAGSTISASSTAVEPDTSYEEQVRRRIADQSRMAGVKPGLPAQGPSNHSQVKLSTIEHQAAIGNALYGFTSIREDGSHSFDCGGGETPSDSETEGTPTSCGSGRFCCNDSGCLGARVSLEYPGPGENTRPEWVLDVGQIKGTTQATIYRCRSPKCQGPNCQEYDMADRDMARADSQPPLGSVSQGYYNIMRNGIHPSNMNRQAVPNEAVYPEQGYPSLKGKHVEPEQPYKSAPQTTPSNPANQYWAQYGETASSSYQAPMAAHQQDVNKIAGLRDTLRLGFHFVNCDLHKLKMRTNPENRTVVKYMQQTGTFEYTSKVVCRECWGKLDTVESLMMLWNNPVVRPRNLHQARVMASVTSQAPPPDQVPLQTEHGGKRKAPTARESSATRKAEPKSRGSRSHSRGRENIDQARPHEQQEIRAEQVDFQQLLPEVMIEQGRVGLAWEI